MIFFAKKNHRYPKISSIYQWMHPVFNDIILIFEDLHNFYISLYLGKFSRTLGGGFEFWGGLCMGRALYLVYWLEYQTQIWPNPDWWKTLHWIYNLRTTRIKTENVAISNCTFWWKFGRQGANRVAKKTTILGIAYSQTGKQIEGKVQSSQIWANFVGLPKGLGVTAM